MNLDVVSIPTGGSERPAPATTVEGCMPVDDAVDCEAQRLWQVLVRARAEYAPRVLAEAEDAVFRYYLPLARSLAADRAAGAPGPVAVVQAAELGLSQAVLSWPKTDKAGFERFAVATVAARLDQCPGGLPVQRPASVPPGFPPPGPGTAYWPHPPGSTTEPVMTPTDGLTHRPPADHRAPLVAQGKRDAFGRAR